MCYCLQHSPSTKSIERSMTLVWPCCNPLSSISYTMVGVCISKNLMLLIAKIKALMRYYLLELIGSYLGLPMLPK